MSRRKGTYLGRIAGRKIFIGPDGKIFAGGNGPDAEAFNKLPSMAVNRANGKEFGLSSHIGSKIRFSLRQYKYLFSSYMHSSLHRRIREICRCDKLHRVGERSFNFRQHGRVLDNFSLSILSYDQLILFPFTLSISENRKEINYNVLTIVPERDLNFPQSTDFFRLFLTATLVPNYIYNELKLDYVPPENEEVILSKTIETIKYEKVSPTPDLSLSLEFDTVPEENTALIVCLGIEFFDVTGSNVFMKREWAAMKVARVA